VYQFDSESNESHNQDTDCDCSWNVQKFCHQFVDIDCKIPFLFGFVHLFKKNAPSLIKSWGTSSSCLSCSDIGDAFVKVEAWHFLLVDGRSMVWSNPIFWYLDLFAHLTVRPSSERVGFRSIHPLHNGRHFQTNCRIHQSTPEPRSTNQPNRKRLYGRCRLS